MRQIENGCKVGVLPVIILNSDIKEKWVSNTPLKRQDFSEWMRPNKKSSEDLKHCFSV